MGPPWQPVSFTLPPISLFLPLMTRTLANVFNMVKRRASAPATFLSARLISEGSYTGHLKLLLNNRHAASCFIIEQFIGHAYVAGIAAF